MRVNLHSSSFSKTLVRVFLCGQLEVALANAIRSHFAVLDIERFYGQPKAIAKRTPIVTKKSTSSGEVVTPEASTSTAPAASYPPTPSVTEGDTATDTELETEVEDDVSPLVPGSSRASKVKSRSGNTSRHQQNFSIDSTISSNGDVADFRPSTSSAPRLGNGTAVGTAGQQRRKVVSHHDLLNKYFRRDAVVIRNVDLLRYVLSIIILIGM
jgi:phosphatidylethanolamine N-methyltransferase